MIIRRALSIGVKIQLCIVGWLIVVMFKKLEINVEKRLWGLITTRYYKLKKQPERDVAMKRQPGVVEAKSHEWKQEIHLWVYVVVVTLMLLESWWWSQYCFFFCLLLVIHATVFPCRRHACWPLTINTIWWWWKRPVCWSGASCPWCPFGSLHCCHPHPFCRNDV